MADKNNKNKGQSDEVQGKCECDGGLVLLGVICFQHWNWQSQGSSFSQHPAAGEMTSQKIYVSSDKDSIMYSCETLL